MPFIPRPKKERPKLIHVDEVEPELHKYLKGSGSWFNEQHIEELRRQTNSAPKEGVFVSPKPLDLGKIAPSKRNIKTPEELAEEKRLREEKAEKQRRIADEQNRLAREAYEKTQNQMIRDERPHHQITHKKAVSEITHPGYLFLIGGGIELHFNSETGDWWSNQNGGRERVATAFMSDIRKLYEEGFDLEDLVAETFHIIKSKGMSVTAIYYADPSEFIRVDESEEEDASKEAE